jgi:hypothetical protein
MYKFYCALFLWSIDSMVSVDQVDEKNDPVTRVGLERTVFLGPGVGENKQTGDIFLL